jgi:predicted Zn finger-like uncharacterized protein
MSDSPLRLKCPNCAGRLSIKDPNLLGKKIKCPRCKELFVAELSPEEEEQLPAAIIEEDEEQLPAAIVEEDPEPAQTKGMPGNKANRKEIRRLEKKRFRAMAWFIFWICMIPGGLCGGCGLAMVIPNGAIQAVLGMVGILAPFVGLGGVLLMLGDRGRYSRSLAIARAGNELDFTYTEQPGRSQRRFLNDFNVFHDPTSDSGLNHMKGDRRGTAVVILDYSCSWGRGKWARHVGQTVFVFQDALNRSTDLVLCPRGLFARLTEAVGLGGKPIPVAGQDDFNASYGLYSPDRKAAAQRFTAELVELCLDQRHLVLEVRNRSLLVYWDGTYIRPNELPDRLETAERILQHLRGDR